MAYGILRDAKLNKMETPTKLKVTGAMRQFKPIFEEYSSSIKDIEERLKPEGYDAWVQKAQKHDEAVKSNSPIGLMTDKELSKIRDIFGGYQKGINEGIMKINSEEHEMTFEKLTKEEFDKLLMGNENFEVSKIMCLEETLT